MKDGLSIPEDFWTELDRILKRYTGIVGELLLQEALQSMGKNGKEEVLITEAPVLLERLLYELNKIASPAFFKRFKRDVIKLFNETFTSL